MNKNGQFIINAVYISAVNILLRCVGVSFNAYVSAKIGAESMGLYTLVMSVYGFAVTLAVAGIGMASVRLTAERFASLASAGASADEYRRCSKEIMYRCSAHVLMFALPAAVLLYFSAPFISEYLLGDKRTLLSLRLLSLSLPAISLSSAISGYFTGVRKVYKSAAAVLAEQAARIVFTSSALAVTVPRAADSVEYSCLAVVGGAAASEVVSLAVNLILYLFDNRRPNRTSPGRGGAGVAPVHLRELTSISLPVAGGALARQGLSTAEHLSIPWGMKKSGLGGAGAMASYGILHGMTFPLILFPSAVISSAGGLLVPELAECSALGDIAKIRRTVSEVHRAALIFSIGCAAVFFLFSDELGTMIYGSEECASRIRAMAPLVPVMYFDTAVDCMLKGLGEQVSAMRINIIDAASSLALVLLLVPRFGISGYIVSVYFCEILNCVMSTHRLVRSSGVSLRLGDLLFPIAAALISALSLNVNAGNIDRGSLSASVRILLFSAVYLGISLLIHICRRSLQNSQKVSVEN